MDRGGNFSSIDLLKTTPLMYAAQAGRASNCEYILETSDLSLNARDKSRMTALGYACQYGHFDAVKVIIEKGGKKNIGVGVDRLPPLGLAAAHGHYELTQALIEAGCNVCGKDKFKRNPLILAIMNGHCKIASLLLQYGAEWNGVDSSFNTPLHYAAGYCWRQAIDTLLKAGASVNAENSWKATPINIAMLKNHYGAVKRLLEESEINVNGKDEDGRTLISLSLMNITVETEEFVQFLIKEKEGDPNIADVNGYTPLHHLASIDLTKLVDEYKYDANGIYMQTSPAEKEAQKVQALELHVRIAKMMLNNGASPLIECDAGQSPFGISLKQNKFPLIDMFISTASFSKDPKLMFEFVDKIYDKNY
jgi:ankyrin repeat protein